MKLEAVVLCDAATVREGLLHTLGAGITRVWSRGHPTSLNTVVAGFASGTRDDTNSLHEIRMIVSSPTIEIGTIGGALKVGQLPPKFEKDERLHCPFVQDLRMIGTNEYGKHSLKITLDPGSDQESNWTHDFWILNVDELALPPI